jgi:ATP-dependent DNA helicase RecG
MAPVTWSELADVVRAGESSTIEFKTEDARPEAVARALCAFLNGRGGRLFIGVADDGRVAGVTRADLQKWVMDIAATAVEPPEIPAYRVLVEPEGARVAVVEVGPGSEKPYRVRHGGRSTCYVRAGNTTRPASRDELRRLYQPSGLLAFDESPVVRAEPAALDRARVVRFYRDVRGRPLDLTDDADYLRTLVSQRLAAVREDRTVCSVAGVLLFAPRPGEYPPGAPIIWVHHDGLDQSGRGGGTDTRGHVGLRRPQPQSKQAFSVSQVSASMRWTHATSVSSASA